jgi:Predicted membrane protein
MRGYRVFAVAVFLTLVAGVIAVPGVALAKSYSVTAVDIEAEVQPDGTLVVTERRTFDFDGDYTFAFWELDVADSQGIEVLGMSGPDGPHTFTDDAAAWDTRPPGTYQVTDFGTYLDARVFFREADTEATFTLEYRVFGAAKRWQDTGELYWKFIGDRWEIPAENVRIHITVPGATAQDVRAWAHGPLTGLVTINDDGTVTLTLDRLPSYTFVEARLLFPATLLPQAPTIPQERVQVVLDEEAEWAEEANASARPRGSNSGGASPSSCCSRSARWRRPSSTSSGMARSTSRSSRATTSGSCRTRRSRRRT